MIALLRPVSFVSILLLRESLIISVEITSALRNETIISNGMMIENIFKDFSNKKLIYSQESYDSG